LRSVEVVQPQARGTSISFETLCNRGHALCHNNEWYHVYCFSDPVDADKFKRRFGGERFNPTNEERVAIGRVGISPRLEAG
jgi:hypothetical protein